MRASSLRFTSAALLFALIAGLTIWIERVAAQAAQPVPPTVAGQPGKKDDKKDKDKDLRPEEDWDIPFAPPYERDASRQLEAVRDYLEIGKKSGGQPPWDKLVPILQRILDSRSDSFFKLVEKSGDKVLTRRISVKTEVNRIISAFPKEGLEFYQQSHGLEAANLLEDAVRNNYDMGMLSDLSQRYFHTKAGAEGGVLLGSLYLERGNYLEAAYAFERIITRPNSDDVLTARTLFKAALAFKRSGDPRHASFTQDMIDRLQKATLRAGIQIGKRTFIFDQLKVEIDRPITSIRTAYAVGEWNGRYGNAQRNGMVDGGAPFLVPAFKPSEMLVDRRDKDKEGNDWIREELSRQFDRDNKAIKSLPLPGFFPVTTPDMVIYRSYDGIHAVATRDHTAVIRGEPKLVRAGDPKWVSKTDFGFHSLMTLNDRFQDPQVKASAEQWWNTYKSPSFLAQSLLYENPTLGSLSHDGQNVYFLDDLAVPPPPQMNDPNFGGFNPGMVKQSGELADAAREGELVAVNINTGLQVWTLGRIIPSPYSRPPALPRMTEEEADKSTSAFHLCLHSVFLGVPLPLNGRLYQLLELDGVVRLLCLDPKNLVAVKDWHLKVPTLVWSQKLGRPNNTMPGDSIRRFQGTFLAAGEGIIICPTNSGMFVGVDIMSRSLLWAHAYKKMDAPQRPVYNPQTGMMNQPNAALAADRWRAAAPIVSGGRAVVTAYDSSKLECLEVRSGKVLWTVPRQTDDLYVGGVVNDKVIVVGRNSVRAYHLSGEADLVPKLAWGDKPTPLPGATPTGHGIASKSAYYLPVRPENAGKDNVPAAEIWAINLETGAVTSKTGARLRKDGGGAELARYGLGNLIFQDGLVIAQSAFEVAVYPQLEVKKAEMDRLLKANPQDPRGLFNRGEIHLDDGKIAEAIADFKEAEKHNPPDELKPSIKDKLYVAFTELLREKFSQSEAYLKEYEALCDVAMEADLEPFEKKRREDESLRRKRLYYSLLARGREDQKRLSEAFDHYLKLATLGESRVLIEMPDEPGVRIRPDVWARGRIEAMIRRAADPVARKTLEERVNQEWATVQTANDRKKLQDFVDVFGPYFPAGSTAQLKLADILIQSGTEDDSREAQVHLSQLRASAEDPAIRARATEALARLMVKNQLMEDAVGLYLQLGREYPTVVIRDGKTGADYLTDLLTDRRLLPFLEPSRYPLPPKMKAEAIFQQNNVNMGINFEVEPEGDLFPMYRRLRFSIDMVSSGNNSWTLRGYDRSTGLEKCNFKELPAPMQYNTGNWQLARHIQASGHLLLVQIGNWIYCFDLAEKKERWRKNLLGDNVNLQSQNPVFDNGDGDVYIQYIDSSKQRIGRIAAIQPGYAAVLTRDGLEVVEPVSRKQLWTRRNVDVNSHIYGDARYITIVEVGADKKPISTRLLRAVDGLTVDGSQDAGRTLAAAKSYKIFGRDVLLHETVGDKHVLRLYDISTGKDVWRKEYDAKAIPLKSMNPEWTGYVKATGEVEILNVATGKPASNFKLDAKYGEAHLKGCTEVQLLADSDRFYVILDRVHAPNAVAMRRNMQYNYSMRSLIVNGPIYAFERTTGKRLWYNEDALENQWLILERFADLPVIIAAAPSTDKNGNQTSYKAVVIEKDQGAIRLNKGLPYNGNFFQSLTVDLKNGEINLHRFDVKVKISPAEITASK